MSAQQDQSEAAVVEAAFIAGFREAPDRQAFLTLAGIPREIAGDGRLGLKLIEVRLDDHFRVGSAAPGFGTRELSYQPLPGALVVRATKLSFVYVSAEGVVEKSLAELRALAQAHSHADAHAHANGHDHQRDHDHQHR